MFCPKCATQNLDGASFCRVCGANISLVPQALSGELAQTSDALCSLPGKGRRKKGKEGGLDSAFRSAFMGLGFVFVALALSLSAMGRGWWFWMLIPAFSMMGTGIAQFIRIREQQKRSLPMNNQFQPSLQSPAVTGFRRRNTGELVAPPPSVTEGTTRHLGMEPIEAQTRHLDAPTKN